MLKKLLKASLLGAIFASFQASAAFVQYDLHDVTFSDGTAVTGYFVQNTANDSVPYFNIMTKNGPDVQGIRYAPSGTFDYVTGVRRDFGGPGPTSFTVYDNLTDVYFSWLTLSFSRINGQNFAVSGSQWQRPIPEVSMYPWFDEGARTITGGTTSLGSINASLLSFLESGGRDSANADLAPLPYRGPNGNGNGAGSGPQGEVPEPGTAALIGLGLLGALVARRRRGA